MIPTPKAKSTRLQLPVGPSGEEPTNAPEGALAYADDTDKVRVQTSAGWVDVGGGGGGGSITSIVEGPGIDITGGTGPVVTVSADTNPATSPFVLKDLNGSYAHEIAPSRDDRVYLQDSVTGTAEQARIRELPVIEKNFSVYTSLAPSVNSDIVFNIDGSPGAVRTCNLGDLAVAGQVTGTLGATKVVGVTETGGPTALTIGPINDFQLLQRVGSTVVGTAYPPTTLAGDVNGPMTANEVNKIHETSGPTALTIGSISDGQALVRTGATLVGANLGETTNPWTAMPSTMSYDDEFVNDTSASYSFYNRTDSVAMTRVGAIDPYGGGALANNQYRSTCYGSWLMIQFPPNKDCLMYKALSTANSIVTARMTGRAYTNGTVNNPYVGLFCAAATGSLPDIQNNSSEIGITTQASTSGNIVCFQVVAGASTSDTTAASSFSNSHMDCFAQRFVGTTRSSWAYSSLNGQTDNVPSRTFAPTVAYVGFRFLTGAGTNPTDQVLAVDFLRIQPNTAWVYGGLPGVTAGNPVPTTLGLPSGNPYIDPPAVAGLYDDEFETGSADLATRGWTVKTDAGATLTRVGDILPWDVTAGGMTSSQYRSSLIGSQLMLQLFPGGNINLSKSTPSGIASGSGATFWCRGGAPAYSQTSATTAYSFTVQLSYDDAGIPAANNQVYMQTYCVGTTATYRVTGGSTVGGSSSTASTRDNQLMAMDMYGVHLKSGTGAWSCFSANSANGSLVAFDSTGPTSTSIRWVGMRLADGATGTGAPNSFVSRIFSIDFFRSTSGTSAWIGQTPRPVLWNVVNGNITDYTQKPAPVAADQIWIADSAASNAIKRATLANVVPLSPYLTPPASPNAFNDEFNEGSADLAIRGWSVINIGTGATMTRAGDIDAYTAPTLTTTTYRSTIRNGRLWLQCSVSLYMYKAVSGSFNITAKCEVSRAQASQIAVIDVYSLLPPITNATRRLYCGMNGLNVEGVKMDINQVYTAIAGAVGIGSASLDAHLLDFNNSGTVVNMQVYGADGRLLTLGTGTLAGFAPAFAGLSVFAGNASVTQWADIDYVRLNPQGSFFPA